MVRALTSRLKVRAEEVPDRVSALQEELRAASKEVSELRSRLALLKAEAMVGQAEESTSGRKVLVGRLDDGVDAASLQAAAVSLQQRLGAGAAVFLASVPEPGKVSLVAALGDEVVKAGAKAGQLVGEVAKVCGGGGGGKPNLAAAGGKDPTKVTEALELARARLLA